MKQRSNTTRRQFLRALGGLPLAIPFLPSLASKAEAQSAEQPPMRLVMALGYFGRDRNYWSPQFSEDQLSQTDGVYHARLSDLNGPISYILGSDWDSLRDKISIIQGLDDLSANSHHNTLLPTAGSAAQPTWTIDTVLSQSSFYASPPLLPVLRTNAHNEVGFGRWSTMASFSWMPQNGQMEKILPDWDPREVYTRYFDAEALRNAAAVNGRVRSVTNAVYDSYKRVMGGPRIGTHDKQVLDNYMSLLSRVDSVLGTEPLSCDQASQPDSLATSEQLHSAMADLETAALACGLTKIVMHSIGQWRSDPSTVTSLEYHSMAHDSRGYFAEDQPDVSLAAYFNRFMLSRAADLLKRLDSVVEADGSTVLDNTLFIYGNEDGNGSHEHVDVPVVVAGGQGKLRLGEYIDFRPRPFQETARGTPLGRPYNQLLVTAFKALGIAESEYDMQGQPGFGLYTGSPYIEHYNPYLGPQAALPLPYLYTGG